MSSDNPQCIEVKKILNKAMLNLVSCVLPDGRRARVSAGTIIMTKPGSHTPGLEVGIMSEDV